MTAQTRDDTNWMKHTVSWQDLDSGKITLGYRPVHHNTLDATEVASFPPQQRKY
jgi:hypothetical protein